MPPQHLERPAIESASPISVGPSHHIGPHLRDAECQKSQSKWSSDASVVRPPHELQKTNRDVQVVWEAMTVQAER